LSAYRDRPLDCPRCRIGLSRRDGREVWSCSRCNGMFVAVGDLVDELLVIAPDLMPRSSGRTLKTLARRTALPLLPCPRCAAPMEPVFVGGIDADRCYHDDHVWFDASEHAVVLDRAREQYAARNPTLFARLWNALLG